jgi:hypothetical protein
LTDLDIILSEESLCDLLDSIALLEAQIQNAVLGKRGQAAHSSLVAAALLLITHFYRRIHFSLVVVEDCR